MNRRDFLKSAVGVAMGLSLPIQISSTLTIVDIKALDSFKEVMKFGGTSFKDGQAFMEISIDTKALWQHIRLIDSEGREWQSADEGTTWRCGLMEFSLEVEDETFT